MAGHCAAEIEAPLAVGDLMPHHAFRETQFFREWVRPQGIVDLVAAVLDRSASQPVVLSIFRHACDGAVDDETRRRMSLVVPHIRRAVLVSRLIDRKTSAAATFTETLDGLRTGICLVDAEGRIIHANNACRAILGAGDFLSGVAGERIAARDGKTDKILRELFAATEARLASGGQGAALPVTAPDGTRYVVHVLPLMSDAPRRATAAGAATAAVFIRKAAIDSPAAPEVIARSYNLTPTELRVLLAIGRSRRGSRGCGVARCCRNHREEASRPSVREDPRQPPGGSGQDRRGILDAARRLA